MRYHVAGIVPGDIFPCIPAQRTEFAHIMALEMNCSEKSMRQESVIQNSASLHTASYSFNLLPKRRDTKSVTALATTIISSIAGQIAGSISQPNATTIHPFSPDEDDRAYCSSM
jgi:hypothetical protein